MRESKPPKTKQPVLPSGSTKPKTCLDCGFLTIEGYELSPAERIMLVEHAGVMPDRPERTRCSRNLWVMYDLTYSEDTFEGVVDELKRPRDNCPGFFPHQAGFTPEEHRQFLIRTPDFLANPQGSLQKGEITNQNPLKEDSHGNTATRSSTKWRDIEIKFISDERITSSNAGSIETLNYNEMGFADARVGKPNLAWSTLLLAAQSGGIIKESMAVGRNRSKMEKRMQEIRKAFREHFGITDDPLPYIKGTGYVAQFKISCAPSYET